MKRKKPKPIAQTSIQVSKAKKLNQHQDHSHNRYHYPITPAQKQLKAWETKQYI